MGCVAVDGYEGCPMRIVLTLASCQSGQRRQAGRSGYRQAYQIPKRSLIPGTTPWVRRRPCKSRASKSFLGLICRKPIGSAASGVSWPAAGGGCGLAVLCWSPLQASNRNYLMPVDAKLKDEADLDFEFIPVSGVRAPMERAAKKTLIFLDACRDDPLARNLARWDLDAKPAAVPLARAARWAGCIIQECGGGRPALDCNDNLAGCRETQRSDACDETSGGLEHRAAPRSQATPMASRRLHRRIGCGVWRRCQARLGCAASMHHLRVWKCGSNCCLRLERLGARQRQITG